MNIVLELKRGISAELYKYRRTFVLWLLVLAPAFVPIINFIILFKKGDQIIKEGQNAWEVLLGNTIQPGNFLFPFFVMVIALFVNSVEHNSNTWKLIYTQPISRLATFISKMKVYVLMVLFSLMLFAFFSLMVGYLLKVTSPELGFDQAFDKSLIFQACFKIFLASLGYASLQFALSQKSKNLMLSMGIGIAGVISVMILMNGWEYADYHPYGYHIFALRDLGEDFNIWSNMTTVYRSLIVALVVFGLSGWDMVRKRIV
ncbi:MAG: ABC transporter permease subunit [Roseivirga sp.]|nr:ABC transporter permease subunit [Roseivirga sp.]